MRFKPRFKTLTADESALVKDPEKHQTMSFDLNEQDAKKMFKDLPWARLLITPRFFWFRD